MEGSILRWPDVWNPASGDNKALFNTSGGESAPWPPQASQPTTSVLLEFTVVIGKQDWGN